MSFSSRFATATLLVVVAACGGTKSSTDSDEGALMQQGQEARGTLYTGSCEVGWFASAEPAAGDAPTVTAYIDGQFRVDDSGGVIATNEPLNVSIGERGRQDHRLVIKAGRVVDAKSNIGDLEVGGTILGGRVTTFDAKLHYDGAKKTLDIDSSVIGTKSFPGKCVFKDESGRELGADR